jgi:hypothetical protein
VSFGKLAALWFGLVAILGVGDLLIMRSLLSPSAPGELHRTEVAGGRLVLPQADGNARAGNSEPEPPLPAETAPTTEVGPLPAETQLPGYSQEQAVGTTEPTIPAPVASSSPIPRTGVSFVPGQPMVDPNPSR